MPLSPNFLPPRLPAPLPQIARPIRTPYACQTPQPVNLPRRTVLLLPLTLLLPTPTLARPKKPLAASLPPLITLRVTLAQLTDEIEQGTIGDIRRVVKTLLVGADLPGNLRDAVEFLPKGEREDVLAQGREVYEYLNQVVEYYDPVDAKKKAGGEVMVFCLRAVERAGTILEGVLGRFGDEGERVRREMEGV